MLFDHAILAYIDPNTSQHVFSLFAPIVACLTAMGGLIATGAVLIRHRIVSYFKKASPTKRFVTLSVVVVALTGVAVLICTLIW